MLLAITMVVSMLVFNVGISDDSMVASAITLPPGITAVPRGKISDLDTSNFTFSNTPSVTSGPALNPIANIFLNTPANDGRVWTDKSVNAVQAFIYDNAGGVVDTIQAPPNEFLVTLSALSQSINIENIIVEPSDTVFIIDVSGSMVSNTVPGTNPVQTRIQVVISALNDAINMLMAADPNNRVSVAIYGGQSVSSQNQARVFPILPLGRYEITPPIFSVSGSTVTVNAAISNPLQRTFTVEGGTPTQLGIRRGGQILLDVNNTPQTAGGTQIDLGTPGNPQWVTRKPNIILMTDGEPTYAWLDYKMDSFANFQGTTTTANWYDVGNGSAGDMGLTTLTVMTAAYVKKLVRDHYYPTEPTRAVGFYTLGLGVNSAIANGMLSPYGTSSSGVPNAQLVTQALGTTTYNMLTTLNSFAPGTTSGPFPYLTRGSSTARQLVTVANDTGILTNNYDTMSFTAMDKAGLDEAFNTITQQIVTQGNYSTNSGGDPQYDGYLAFSDVIGEYMEFGDFLGLWYDNVKNDGTTFKNAMTAATPPAAIYNFYRDSLTRFITKPGVAPANVFLPADADALISSSRAAGAGVAGTSNRGGLSTAQNGNKVVYYADQNRNWVSNYYDAGGAPIGDAAAISTYGAYAKVELYTVQGSAVDALDGTTATDQMLIVFQVITAIQNGRFVNYNSDGTHLVSPLLTGDQIVRWYIPASLIPLRGVKPVTNTDGTIQKDDFGFDMVQVSEAVPLRVIYSIVPNVTKIRNNMTAEYMNTNKSPSPNGFYFYANRWRGMDGRVSSTSPRNDLANMTQSFFEPYSSNEFYKQVLTDSTIIKAPNVTGPTGTSPWQWRNSSFTSNPTIRVQQLGNNGRIELQTQARITLEKSFSFSYLPTPPSPLPPDPVPDPNGISFMIYGQGSDGVEIFRATILYSDFVNGRYTLNIPPGDYSIIERGGQIANYTLAQAMPTLLHIPAGFDGTLTPFPIDNAYTYHPDPDVRIQKVFHGLQDSEIALLTNFRLEITDPNGIVHTITQVDSPSFSTSIGVPIEGRYWVREFNCDLPGYILQTRPQVLPFYFDVSAEAVENSINNGLGILIVLNNFYRRPVYNLDLEKIVRPTPLVVDVIDDFGNTNSVVQEPLDLSFKIERVRDAAGNPDSGGGYLYTVRWADLINNKYSISNIPAGTYTITELGGAVDGYTGPSVSTSSNTSLVPNPAVPTVPNSYIFTLTADSDINISFTYTNVYTRLPPNPPIPPPPPAPQTGVDRNIFIPIAMLSFGFLWIAGAEIYRRKGKKQ